MFSVILLLLSEVINYGLGAGNTMPTYFIV